MSMKGADRIAGLLTEILSADVIVDRVVAEAATQLEVR